MGIFEAHLTVLGSSAALGTIWAQRSGSDSRTSLDMVLLQWNLLGRNNQMDTELMALMQCFSIDPQCDHSPSQWLLHPSFVMKRRQRLNQGRKILTNNRKNDTQYVKPIRTTKASEDKIQTLKGIEVPTGRAWNTTVFRFGSNLGIVRAR